MTHRHKWKKDGAGYFIFCECGEEKDWDDVIVILNESDASNRRAKDYALWIEHKEGAQEYFD